MVILGSSGEDDGRAHVNDGEGGRRGTGFVFPLYYRISRRRAVPRAAAVLSDARARSLSRLEGAEAPAAAAAGPHAVRFPV